MTCPVGLEHPGRCRLFPAMDGDSERGLGLQACDERGDRGDDRQGLKVVDLHIGRCLLWRSARAYQY